MGTDIFLSWNGISNAERKAQQTSADHFSLDTGEVGYIRAAIGMRRENGLLGYVFPNEFWFNKTGRPIPYDFGNSIPKVKNASEIYLKSIEEDSAPDFGEAYQRAVALDIETTNLMKRKGYELVQATSDLKGEDAVAWLKSLWRFFDLGLRMQNQGKSPRIFISW